MINKVYATKLSMSQVFQKGKRSPVTLFNVPSHIIIGNRLVDKDGYSAVILAIGKKKKKVNKVLLGQLKKSKINFHPKFIKEVPIDKKIDINLGRTIDLAKILLPNTLVDVCGTSKGKGFSGVIKRWGFSAQPRTHGQSDRRRAPGSIGRGTTPGRVLPGKKMAGRLGNQSTYIYNLKIISFDAQSGKLIISGPVPGAKNSLVRINIVNREQPPLKDQSTNDSKK